MKRFIQIFLESLMMIGIKTINVLTMAIKEVRRLVPMKRKLIIKAATAKAIPTA